MLRVPLFKNIPHVTDRPTGESFQAMVFGESRGNQHLELGSKKKGVLVRI